MRRLTRACARAYDHEGSFALVAVVSVTGLFFAVGLGLDGLSGFTVRPGNYLLNCWLLLMLGASYSVWTAVRLRRRVEPTAAMGFVTAAAGLAARYYCDVLVLGLGETYGSYSVIEQTATPRTKLLIATHRYGGLVAFALGLAVVVWAILRAGRARPFACGSPRSPGTA